MTTSDQHRQEYYSVDDAINDLDSVDNVDETPDAEDADESPETEAEAEVTEEEVDAETDAPDEAGDEDGEDETEASDPDADDAETDPEEENGEGGDEAENEEAETPIPEPQFWDAEGKAEFAKLPKEAKQAVLKYEQQRSAAVSRKMQELATIRERAEQRVEGLDEFVSETERQIEAYAKVDWTRAARELNPQDYQQYRSEYEALKEQKTKATEAKARAEQDAFREFAQQRAQDLQTVAPQFLDPQNGAELDKNVTQYLVKQGYDANRLQWADAHDLAIAHKAYLYDQLQAKAKAAPKPKPKPQGSAKPKPGVKPSQPQPATSPQKARKAKLAKKSSLSISEALELME